MIQKYEGFLSNLFKKKNEPVKSIVRTPLISYESIVELSNDCFIDLQDRGYIVKTKYDLNEDIYVQITKHTFYKSGRVRPEDIPYKFIDVKDDVLSFYDRLKEYDSNIKFSVAFVYENDKGGLSCDNPKYNDFEKGDYDNREVSILTISII
jgi:hypothetical protein